MGIEAQQRDGEHEREDAERDGRALAQPAYDHRGQTQRQSALDGGFSHG